MKLKRYSGWTQRNHQYLKTGIMSRGQAAGSRKKDHFRMENWTEASSSSIPCRICSMKTNSDKDIREWTYSMKCQMREQNKEDIFKCHNKFNLIIQITSISWISKIINWTTFLQNKSDLYFIKSLIWSKKRKCAWKFMISINRSESQSFAVTRLKLTISKSTKKKPYKD